MLEASPLSAASRSMGSTAPSLKASRLATTDGSTTQGRTMGRTQSKETTSLLDSIISIQTFDLKDDPHSPPRRPRQPPPTRPSTSGRKTGSRQQQQQQQLGRQGREEEEEEEEADIETDQPFGFWPSRQPVASRFKPAVAAASPRTSRLRYARRASSITSQGGGGVGVYRTRERGEEEERRGSGSQRFQTIPHASAERDYRVGTRREESVRVSQVSPSPRSSSPPRGYSRLWANPVDTVAGGATSPGAGAGGDGVEAAPPPKKHLLFAGDSVKNLVPSAKTSGPAEFGSFRARAGMGSLRGAKDEFKILRDSNPFVKYATADQYERASRPLMGQEGSMRNRPESQVPQFQILASPRAQQQMLPNSPRASLKGNVRLGVGSIQGFDAAVGGAVGRNDGLVFDSVGIEHNYTLHRALEAKSFEVSGLDECENTVRRPVSAREFPSRGMAEHVGEGGSVIRSPPHTARSKASRPSTARTSQEEENTKMPLVPVGNLPYVFEKSGTQHTVSHLGHIVPPTTHASWFGNAGLKRPASASISRLHPHSQCQQRRGPGTGELNLAPNPPPPGAPPPPVRHVREAGPPPTIPDSRPEENELLNKIMSHVLTVSPAPQQIVFAAPELSKRRDVPGHTLAPNPTPAPPSPAITPAASSAASYPHAASSSSAAAAAAAVGAASAALVSTTTAAADADPNGKDRDETRAAEAASSEVGVDVDAASAPATASTPVAQTRFEQALPLPLQAGFAAEERIPYRSVYVSEGHGSQSMDSDALATRFFAVKGAPLNESARRPQSARPARQLSARRPPSATTRQTAEFIKENERPSSARYPRRSSITSITVSAHGSPRHATNDGQQNHLISSSTRTSTFDSKGHSSTFDSKGGSFLSPGGRQMSDPVDDAMLGWEDGPRDGESSDAWPSPMDLQASSPMPMPSPNGQDRNTGIATFARSGSKNSSSGRAVGRTPSPIVGPGFRVITPGSHGKEGGSREGPAGLQLVGSGYSASPR